jgi:cytochrome c
MRPERALRVLCWLAFMAAAVGCDKRPQPAPLGDAENGKLLLRQFACGSCHTIPGVAAARGVTGPPLEGVGRRVYLGGVLPNSPENMALWIQHPQRFEPGTAMPDLGVTPGHARDMAAYLSRLK